ncbi:MAG: NifU family protein [Planctomycetes bacterium]|nr:NifU family protein [Planctomycetota bacterium]
MDEEKIKAVIAEIRPMLQADGGDVEFVGIEGTTVKVRLQGACHGCPHAAMTIKQGVEARIREVVPEVTEVVAVQ